MWDQFDRVSKDRSRYPSLMENESSSSPVICMLHSRLLDCSNLVELCDRKNRCLGLVKGTSIGHGLILGCHYNRELHTQR